MSLYSVILPVYNEKDNLPLMVSMLSTMFENGKLRYEIVIVEDNSVDGTREIALKLQAIFGENLIKVLLRPGKMGLGSAYIDGLQLCTGDFVILMDADMSHHPNCIPTFIAKQKEKDYDIVTGTRYGLGGGVAGWDLSRIIISRGANLIANLLLRSQISDLTGAFRLYKKSVLRDLISSVKGRAYVFQMEIIMRAQKKGYSISEIPIVFVDRFYGESKLGANEIVSYLQGLWNLFIDL